MNYQYEAKFNFNHNLKVMKTNHVSVGWIENFRLSDPHVHERAEVKDKYR